MHFQNISRRTLIRGIGGASMALPFLELTHEKAWAQQGAPKRLVIYFNGEGNLINQWKPNVPSGSALPANLPPMLSALNKYVPKMLLMHPIDNVVADMMGGNGHNKAGRSILSCNTFTAGEATNAAGPSIDQYIKQKLGAKSLELRVGGGVGEYQMLFSGPNQAVSGDDNPQRVFDRLFTTLPATGGGGAVPAPLTAADRLRAKQKDVLSLVKDNFSSVRNQLGVEDKQRLDAHAQRLQDLEKELADLKTAPPTTVAQAMCAKPVLGALANHPQKHAAQAKIAAMAMACNQAQVVTIQDTEYDSQSFSWVGANFPQRWHLCVHDRTPMSELQKGYAWYATAFKDILDAMDAIPEGDGTVLDHSLVVWVTEYGDGASHDTHGIPVVWAGGLSGAVKMNRFLSFPNGTVSTNQMYVTIMNLFGINETKFGVGPKASGTLPGVV